MHYQQITYLDNNQTMNTGDIKNANRHRKAWNTLESSSIMFTLVIIGIPSTGKYSGVTKFGNIGPLIARFMGPTWGPPRSDMLIHLLLDKMTAILADDNFKCIFLNEDDWIPIRISLKFVPRSAIDNKPALVQEMAWRRTGHMPVSELMLAQFIDAYVRH